MASFFHSLVVFGASSVLAGCGGSSGATGKLGTSGGAGGATADGGSPFVSSGGALGEAPADGSVRGCSQLFSGCIPADGGERVFVLGAACADDPGRPRSAADCPPGRVFRCDSAVHQGASVAVDCDCAPAAACDALCSRSISYGLHEAGGTCTARGALCGCAYSGILVK